MCKRTAAVSETLLKALKLKVAQCKELKPEIRTHDVYCIAKVCILKNQENMIFMLNNGYTEIAHFPCEKFLGVGIPNLNYISPAIFFVFFFSHHLQKNAITHAITHASLIIGFF